MQHRKHLRVNAPVAIMLHYKDTTEVCVTRNFSLGGLFAVTGLKPAEGELVTVTFVLGGERFSAVAEVRNMGSDGIGIAYLDKTDNFRSRLGEVLNGMLESKGYPALPSMPREVWVTWDSSEKASWLQRLFGLGEDKQRVSNLHVEGASVISKRKPTVGTVIKLKLALPGLEDSNYPVCQAEVVRHIGDGFAVRFVDPKAEFRLAVEALRRPDDENEAA